MTYSNAVVDSYTGFYWCGAGLHLLDEHNADPQGKCRPCARLSKRRRRAK